jgi:hypothetical protein
VLINSCLLLAEKRLPKTSKNSDTPPSADPNREKTSKAKEKERGNPEDNGETKGRNYTPLKLLTRL